MSSAQYLYRRASGTYYVRLCVPARLQEAVGHGEIHRTTGCRDFRLAKIVAAELAAHWHRSIQSLDRMGITKIKAGSIKLLGDGYVSLVDASNALGTTPLILAQRVPCPPRTYKLNQACWERRRALNAAANNAVRVNAMPEGSGTLVIVVPSKARAILSEASRTPVPVALSV